MENKKMVESVCYKQKDGDDETKCNKYNKKGECALLGNGTKCSKIISIASHITSSGLSKAGKKPPLYVIKS